MKSALNPHRHHEKKGLYTCAKAEHQCRRSDVGGLKASNGIPSPSSRHLLPPLCLFGPKFDPYVEVKGDTAEGG